MELKTCPIHGSSPDADRLACRPCVDKTYVDASGKPRKYRLKEIARWRVRCPVCYAEEGPFGNGLGAGVRAETFEEAVEKWNRKCMDVAVKTFKKIVKTGAPAGKKEVR